MNARGVTESIQDYESCDPGANPGVRVYMPVWWNWLTRRTLTAKILGSSPSAGTNSWGRMFQGGEKPLQGIWVGSIPSASTMFW